MTADVYTVTCVCIELEDALVRTEEERVTLLCSADISGANQNDGSTGMPAVCSGQN